jgi:SAM-dependent methyltransferase
MIGSHKKNLSDILGREPVHPFPARMAPGIALEIIAKSRKPLRVLDPMSGSGTVLAVARAKGHRATGIDIDPLAVLIATVWTTSIDGQAVKDCAAQVLTRARRRFSQLLVRDAYPPGADEETKGFVTYWFDAYARRQLAALATEIARVHEKAIRNALWCGFSRLIITKQSGASLAMDLAHSRPHKTYTNAPTKPFTKFLSAMDRVVDNCLDASARFRGPQARVSEGDARALPLKSSTVDLVLTSPPYLNAIDYMRCSKFSLIWMGYSIAALRKTRAVSVGTEVGMSDEAGSADFTHVFNELKLGRDFAGRDRSLLARYIADMGKSVSEVARVLVPGGTAVYVIGENTIRGTFIRNSLIISAVAELAGLKTCERRVRTLPANRRYLPPPASLRGSALLDSRMRREVVLRLKKDRRARA